MQKEEDRCRESLWTREGSENTGGVLVRNVCADQTQVLKSSVVLSLPDGRNTAIQVKRQMIISPGSFKALALLTLLGTVTGPESKSLF